jgi:hypothetical protein
MQTRYPRSILLVLALVLLISVAGCRPDDDDGDEIIEDTVIEGEIITDADTVEEGELVTFTVPDDTETDTAGAIANADGFRIQLLASTNESRARELASEAQTILGVPVYVEYLDGYWKVRAGDCATRAEAETLRNQARGAGYADCWIAATRIVQ